MMIMIIFRKNKRLTKNYQLLKKLSRNKKFMNNKMIIQFVLRKLGWPVDASSLCQWRSLDWMVLVYLLEMISWRGMNTRLLLTCPTEKPVNPAMRPWVALWPSWLQTSLSWGLACTLLIIYAGSIYLRVTSIICSLQYFTIYSRRKIPMSPLFTFPLASFP